MNDILSLLNENMDILNKVIYFCSICLTMQMILKFWSKTNISTMGIIKGLEVMMVLFAGAWLFKGTEVGMQAYDSKAQPSELFFLLLAFFLFVAMSCLFLLFIKAIKNKYSI